MGDLPKPSTEQTNVFDHHAVWKLLPDKFLGILYAEKICITYSFVVGNPNILGNFLLFVGQDQLGENYFTDSRTGIYLEAPGNSSPSK